ncbi:MAG: K(+)-transporting ATPase subunit F [Prochlorotrichaceae cyanobacterium]
MRRLNHLSRSTIPLSPYLSTNFCQPMKPQTLFGKNNSIVSAPFLESGLNVYDRWQRSKMPRLLAIALGLNLILAPAVQAATGNVLSRSQAYALGLLGLLTLALSVYLFVVMFQPERF